MTIAGDRRLTDAALKAKLEREKKTKVAREALAKDVNETFSTASGRRTLRHLMEQCCYQSHIAMPGTSTDNMIFNEARRSLYIDLRRLVSTDVLIAVENKGLQQDERD